MADENLVTMLLRSVTEWNAWRSQEHLAPIDLTRADLHEANLCGANLDGVNFSKANLSGANLT